MRNHQNPCASCDCWACDYRQCEPYKMWIRDAWQQFGRHCRHTYWSIPSGDDKLAYVHPDVIRRYLQEGPCKRCECARTCKIPCEKYCRWWDARMVWLKRKLQSPLQ